MLRVLWNYIFLNVKLLVSCVLISVLEERIEIDNMIVMEITVTHMHKFLIYFLYMEGVTKFLGKLAESLTKTVHTYLAPQKVYLKNGSKFKIIRLTKSPS